MCPFILTIFFYIAKLELPPKISVLQYCEELALMTGPYSCSTELRILFIMLINVRIQIIVGILICMSMIDTTP